MPSSGVQTCALDRKSTRLNSSHTIISYAVFCLQKKILSHRPACEIPRDPPHTDPILAPQGADGGEPGARRGRRDAGRRSWRDRLFFFFNARGPPDSSLFPPHAALPI